MQIVLLIVFVISVGLSVWMEFTSLKYINLNEIQRTVWRMIMAGPLVAIALNNINDYNPYNIFVFALMLLILVADVMLIQNINYGILAFAMIHIGIGLFFYVIYPHYNIQIIVFSVFLFIVGLILWQYIKPNEMFFKIAILFYVMIMMFTLSRIIGFNLQFGNKHLLLAGYVLFVLTDFEVAWMHFNNRFPYDQIINNILYYGALGLIAYSGVEQ